MIAEEALRMFWLDFANHFESESGFWAEMLMFIESHLS